MVVELWLLSFLRMILSALSGHGDSVLENCPNEFMSLVSAISLCTEVSRTDRRSRDNNSSNGNSCTDRRTRSNQSESIQKAADTKMISATKKEPKLMSISKGTSAKAIARTNDQWRRALG